MKTVKMTNVLPVRDARTRIAKTTMKIIMMTTFSLKVKGQSKHKIMDFLAFVLHVKFSFYKGLSPSNENVTELHMFLMNLF